MVRTDANNNFDTITDLASTKLNVIFFSASIPANVEYDISGKELYDHFSRTNGCHFTFLDEEGWIEKNYKMKVQLRLIINTFLEFYMYR